MNQKTQTKVCPNCHKKFPRRATESLAEWRNRKYCTRTCQVTKDAKKRNRKNPNLTSVALWDACTKYMVGAQERLSEQVKTYDVKNMTEEELQKLIPSEQ